MSQICMIMQGLNGNSRLLDALESTAHSRSSCTFPFRLINANKPLSFCYKATTWTGATDITWLCLTNYTRTSSLKPLTTSYGFNLLYDRKNRKIKSATMPSEVALLWNVDTSGLLDASDQSQKLVSSARHDADHNQLGMGDPIYTSPIHKIGALNT